MRPPGEVRLALLRAVGELATPERGPTLREVAEHAGVGRQAATHTIGNLRRYGVVVVARTRRVPYRNRPVAEYALPVPGDDPAVQGVRALMAAWAGPAS